MVLSSLSFVLVMTPSCVLADEWMGRVIRVLDGDSLLVARDHRAVKIRLVGVDAPEHGQPFAREAEHFVRQRVDRQRVQVKEKAQDGYGRTIAWVTPPDGEELGEALVRVGLAWHYRSYSRDAHLAALEKRARKAGLGLWSQSAAVPPWVWRHRRPSTRLHSTQEPAHVVFGGVRIK